MSLGVSQCCGECVRAINGVEGKPYLVCEKCGRHVSASELPVRERHVFLPYSERGQTGHPPIGAVAVCGAVQTTADRAPVPFDHPDGCQECIEKFNLIEREWARLFDER